VSFKPHDSGMRLLRRGVEIGGVVARICGDDRVEFAAHRLCAGKPHVGRAETPPPAKPAGAVQECDLHGIVDVTGPLRGRKRSRKAAAPCPTTASAA
jgi:hypothetical protein